MSCAWLITSPQRDSEFSSTDEPDRFWQLRHCVTLPGQRTAAGHRIEKDALSVPGNEKLQSHESGNKPGYCALRFLKRNKPGALQHLYFRAAESEHAWGRRAPREMPRPSPCSGTAGCPGPSVQLGGDCLRGWRRHRFPRQPLPGSDHPHGKIRFFPCV